MYRGRVVRGGVSKSYSLGGKKTACSLIGSVYWGVCARGNFRGGEKETRPLKDVGPRTKKRDLRARVSGSEGESHFDVNLLPKPGCCWLGTHWF